MLREIYRKFCFVCILLTVLLSCSSLSAAVNKNAKHKLSLLKNCSFYQLGASEFVMKITGRKLPEPETEFIDDTMHITFHKTLADNPRNINAQMKDISDVIPLIYDFNVENVSDDRKNVRAVVSIKTTHQMNIDSIRRTSEGYTLRIKTLETQSSYTNIPSVNSETQSKPVSPEHTLPFRVNTRVSVEFRDAELRDIFRMLMSQIGRNIIIDSSFPSNVLVTMSLEDVRVDDILNHLLRTYDIACYPSGKNTTTFGTYEGLYKLSGAKTLKSFHVSYAEPAQVKTILSTLAGLQESDITLDERLKTVYVRTNPAKMSEVEELIDRIDSPQPQIMIHASIFEFSDTVNDEVNNALNIAYDEWQLSLGGEKGIDIDYYEDRSRTNRNPRTARTIRAQFSALEQKGKGKVLANPSVIAVEGKQASINLTEDYPYISNRDQAGNVTWSTEEVGPKLTFTPKIGRDGYINLTLRIETGEVIEMIAGSTGEQMPRTSTRQVTTEIRVRDGMPFVIGGLFRENKTIASYRIPVIGSIPLIGDLFTYKVGSNVKTQVVIVVTPYILDSK